MPELDLSHLPKGQRGWPLFVEAFKDLDDGAERHFLEFKSDVNPASKVGAAKIAKFILGAANRSPARAARVLDGHALLVIGISQGRLEGIPSFEVKNLEHEVCKFVGVGTDGPGWQLQSVAVADNKQIIIIQVDPPELGGTLWTCLSDGVEGLTNGRIYIRVEGTTREAHGDEIRALLAEKASRQPEAQLDVQVMAVAMRFACDDQVLEDYLARERKRLLDALPKPKGPDVPGSSGFGPAFDEFMNQATNRSMLTSNIMSTPEKRTVEAYKTEIDHWEHLVRSTWSAALDRVAGLFGSGAQIKTVNLSKIYLEDLA